jgi:hypothetical protein
MQTNLAILAIKEQGLTYRPIAETWQVCQRPVSQVVNGNRSSMEGTTSSTDSRDQGAHRNELFGGCTNNGQGDGRHGECEIPNSDHKAERFIVEEHVANHVSTAITSAVSDRAAEGLLVSVGARSGALMDAAEAAGRPLIIVFSDESPLFWTAIGDV